MNLDPLNLTVGQTALQEPPENWELAKRVFERMNVEYTAVMRRFTSHGGVKVIYQSAQV